MSAAAAAVAASRASYHTVPPAWRYERPLSRLGNITGRLAGVGQAVQLTVYAVRYRKLFAASQYGGGGRDGSDRFDVFGTDS